MEDLTRPIIGIENRTPQEVFDIMCDRFRGSSIAARLESAEKALSQFHAHYPMGINPFLDDAFRAARAHMEKYHGR